MIKQLNVWTITLRMPLYNIFCEFFAVVPRFLFEGWSPQDFSQLLSGPREERVALVNTIKKICKQWKFDGIVMEILTQISGRVNYEIAVDLLKFLGVFN